MVSDVPHAEEVIKKIRKGHGIIEGDLIEELETRPDLAAALTELHVNLRNSLKLLSEELNTKDAHCVLEMVQNADDNQYGLGVQPKLHFHLQPMQLRVDCNETGFSEANVKAICSIGQSTKPIEGCIGEKGIGFKSCWKIANIVAISSGPYSFKFDRSKDLGMIAPIAAEFPTKERVQGCTQFLLELQSAEKEELLRKELRNLPPTLIMFLRRLKNIRVEFDNGDYKEISYQPSDKYETPVLAGEKKRPGVLKTEIVLAFPMDADGEPLEETQNVHAFLPLRDYGLEVGCPVFYITRLNTAKTGSSQQFIVQTDFLLPATREDILRCPWNEHLLSSIPIAFLRAVDRLNNIETLRYTWIRYIPHKIPTSFLSSLPDRIKQRLKTSKVLWSWTEVKKEPQNLLHVPQQYLDRNGLPLLAHSSRLDAYLSPKYDWATDELSLTSVGVTTISTTEFLRALSKLSSNSWDNRSSEWHEDVATALVGLSFTRWSNELLSLPIIPLRDGTWVSKMTSGGATYLDHEADLKVPAGIEMQLVHSQAMASPVRVSLFEKLGLKRCDVRDVARTIVTTHLNAPGGFGTSYIETFYHLVYLFRARSSLPTLPYKHLWIVDKHRQWAKACDLYMDSPNMNGLEPLFSTKPEVFGLLHHNYIEFIAATDRAAWLEWLEKKISVSTRISVYKEGDPSAIVKGGTFSPAFDHLVRNHSSRMWLDLLMNPLVNYDPHVSVATGYELGVQMVSCADGTVQKLNETILPTEQLMSIAQDLGIDALPFLSLTDPDNTEWPKVLNSVGVPTKAETVFYMRILVHLRETGVTDRELLLKVYQKMTEAVGKQSNMVQLRHRFQNEKLIFLAPINQSPWITSYQCVWDGPRGLRDKEILCNYWPECKSLFCNILGIKGVSFDTVYSSLEIAITRSQRTQREDLKHLIACLAHFDINSQREENIRKLEGKKIFPVRGPTKDGGRAAKESIEDSSSLILIADVKNLRDDFVPYFFHLDLPVDVVFRLQDIFKILRMDDKLMSRCLEKVDAPASPMENDESLTIDLRSKAVCFTRCANLSKMKKNEQEVLKLLLSVKVYTALKIVSVQKVMYQNLEKTLKTDTELGFRIEASANGKAVEILLPQDEKRRGYICRTQLHTRLATCLGIPSQSGRILAILHNSVEEAEEYLTEEGIPALSSASNLNELMHLNVEEIASLSVPSSVARDLQESGSGSSGNEIFQRRSRNGNRSVGRPLHHGTRSDDPLTTRGLASGPRHIADPASASQARANISNDEMGLNIRAANDYNRQLQTVIRSGQFRPEATSSSTSTSIYIAVPPTNSQSRPRTSNDIDVGFLGEQYVFDILKREVPGFGQQHWTSNLKKHAMSHPAYQDVQSYDAYEVSDFVFKDVGGALTRFLVRSGHQRADRWLADPPQYFLEVKATTGNQDIPFSMSNYQAELALNLKTVDEDSQIIPQAAYIIFRVFHVKTSPKHTIYLDPGRLLSEGKLRSSPIDGVMVWPV
ncbi:hypothetical protein MMC18_003209 [Xylographa bjoerkii]|nr:hypothetical protein [Xylographa bjoerkii]